MLSYGSGLYNWFNGMQDAILEVTSSTDVNLYAHNTHGVANLLAGDSKITASGLPWNMTTGFCPNFVADIPVS